MIASRDPIPTVSVGDVAAARGDARDHAPILLDVRDPAEFVEVRVEGAVLMPLPRIMVRFRELPTDRPIHVICRSGDRSALVTRFLIASGYRDVANVAGGMIAWLRAGYPARSGPPGDGEGELPL
jgi:rhodanese-related sulfurtransferase